MDGDSGLVERVEGAHVGQGCAAQAREVGDDHVGDLAVGGRVEQFREAGSWVAGVGDDAGLGQVSFTQVLAAVGFLPGGLLTVAARCAGR